HGRDGPLRLADRARLGQEAVGLAGVELALALGASLHERAAARLVLAVQMGDEAQRGRGEDAVVEVRLPGGKVDAGDEVVALHDVLRFRHPGAGRGPIFSRPRRPARCGWAWARRRTARPRSTPRARWWTTCRPGSPGSRRRNSRCPPRAGASRR